MNEQPLDDDAELLRSLKPTQPEVNWQKVLAHLPESTLPDLNRSQPRIKRLVSSWWSGALAGSLITFALLRIAGPFAGTQSVPNEPQDIAVARSGQNTLTTSQQTTDASGSSNSNEPQNRNRPQRDAEGWDLIVDSGVWTSRLKRHGLGEKLVSKSATAPTESTHTYESTLNSSYGLPKSQAELRRELLDFN
jgi:hypothetical protein